MVKRLEIAGEKYNRLTAIRRLAGGLWEFQCDCGSLTECAVKLVRSGNTKSCGCLKRDSLVERNTTHGKSNSSLYRRYCGMIARCNNPSHTSYSNYGERGIKVCDRWLESFENFLADMGYPKAGESIDRIDSNGNYCPENCRWADRSIQSRNTKRNVFVSVNGVTKTVKDWEVYNGVSRGTYQRRINLGWSKEKAVTESVQPGKPLRSRK